MAKYLETRIEEVEQRLGHVENILTKPMIVVDDAARRIEQRAADAHKQRQEDYDSRGHTEPSDAGDQHYMVVKKWTCECPSFRYQRGVDYRGHCKHIRRVLSRRP